MGMREGRYSLERGCVLERRTGRHSPSLQLKAPGYGLTPPTLRSAVSRTTKKGPLMESGKTRLKFRHVDPTLTLKLDGIHSVRVSWHAVLGSSHAPQYH